ncbi:hypothetical protein NIES4103_02340 [Nostoc sp. NIES-4103]|nr:hypothetical protein NIES4103_02340 [Nostoc sp. NIES-4103]
MTTITITTQQQSLNQDYINHLREVLFRSLNDVPLELKDILNEELKQGLLSDIIVMF